MLKRGAMFCQSILVGLVVTTLSACTMAAPGDAPGVAHVWRSETTWGADGQPVTVQSHRTETIIEPVKGPEWDFQGVWGLEEYLADTDRMGQMECLMRLDPAKVSDQGYKVTLAPDCPAEVRHIASWYPAGHRVILLNANDEILADLVQRSGKFYRGEIVLASQRKMNIFFVGY